MRPIVIIADDFGLSPEVDAGILALVHMRRLSGFGCLTQLPRWFEAARQVPEPTSLPMGLAIGLHLNLTQGFAPNTWFRPLPLLIASAYSGLLPRAKIRASLTEQLDRFMQAFGCAPDYIDGHQHVHQLPIVRECVLELIQAQNIQPWIRSTAPLIAPKISLKEWMIAHLGAPVLRIQAQRAGLVVPPAFAGVYDFNKTPAGYLALLDDWLHSAPIGALVMCHPATAAEVSHWDPIARASAVELAVLQSEAFADLLIKNQRVIYF